MDSRWEDYSPPGANGPLVWYMVKGQSMEIRMTDGLIDDCFSAAETLGARFFIMRRSLGIGLANGWAVFDTKNPLPDNDHPAIALQGGKRTRPLRIFDTDTIEGPEMWVRVMGGMK